MREKMDEIIARHDAATACGCSCCDTDYTAYVDQKNRKAARDAAGKDDTLPESAASRRKSVRYVFENLSGKRAG